MGNITNSNKKFLQDWVQVEKQGSPGQFTNTWIQKKGNTKIQMIEYPLHVSSEEDIEQERQIFWSRLNHPQLVSSLYFLDETKNEFCSSNYQGNIFIERIPLTLQTVTDVPFPDALHIYSQSLIGFHILASDIVKSCFPISQQHIGINCEAVCKVWMNPRYEKNFPSRNQRIHQHAMVRMILQTIEENVDLGSLQGIPSPAEYISRNARSPAEVRFDQAINLFQNYVKEFFKGQVPRKLECVDKVGGIYNLSKNWKNKYDSLENAVRNQDPELVMSGLRQQQINSTSNLNQNINQFTQTNNYTAFRRQEPMMQTFTQQNQNETMRGTTPSFSRAGEANVFTGSRVGQPIISQQVVQPQVIQQVPPQPQFQQSRVIQQVVYQNPTQVPAEIVRTFSQKQISGSIVRVPAQNGVVNTQRSQVKESFIQNRVINSQVNSPQPVLIQQAPQQPRIIQQGSIIQQTPVQIQRIGLQPIFIQQSPRIQFSNVRVQPVTVPLNPVPQFVQIPQVNNNQQVVNQPGGQINIVRRSNISFGNQVVQPQQQIIGQPQFIPPQQQIVPQQQIISGTYQVAKTSSVYATPQGVTKVETQRIEQRNELIERQDVNRVEAVSDQLNLRLRNNEESISSINPQTNQVPSNQQISDKFSMMKQEVIDTSTRNFYNNMMNGGQTTPKQQGNNDYFSSYYANYTSKLYDNSEPAEVQSPLKRLSTKNEERESYQVGNKYNVTLDDGMSSADFLNQLKNIKSSSTASPFLKTEANYDYGLTNKYTDNSDELYKFDYKNYTAKLTNDADHQKDLNVVVEKLNIAPATTNYSQQKDQYNINYEHQSGRNDAGNLRYESEQIQVSGNDGSYAEEYYQTSNYQSTFDKYAASGKYQSQIPISIEQKDFQLGENIQTQFSRNITDDVQYFDTTKNTVNNTSYNYSPMHQNTEEQYQVEYDPQILADLQKLKGVN